MLEWPEIAANPALTTADVCNKVIKPLTARHKCALADLVNAVSTAAAADKSGQAAPPTPTLFVSHAWQNTFRETVSAILTHVGGSGSSASERHIWVDLAAINQHSNEVGHPGFDDLLRQSLMQSGTLLLVCLPWHAPVSFGRCWCLFEVLEAVKAKVPLSVGLAESERESFARAVLGDVSAAVAIFIGVDARRAQAFLPEDRERIFDWISSSVGFEKMNAMVQRELCVWLQAGGGGVLDVLAAEAEQAGDAVQLARIRQRKRDLASDMARYERVPPLHQASVLQPAAGDPASALDPLAVPVMLSTTSHRSMAGGVLAHLLNIFVALPDFRHDVLHASAGEAGVMRASSLHGEFRAVCALWERASDGIISLDLLIDALPEESRKMALQPSDIAEFLSMLLDEVGVLGSFWPELQMITVVERTGQTPDDPMVASERAEKTWFYRVTPPLADGEAGPAAKQDLASLFVQTELTWEDFDTDAAFSPDSPRRLGHRTSVSANGRVCFYIQRFTLNFVTLKLELNDADLPVPESFSYKGVVDGADDSAYPLLGVIAHERTRRHTKELGGLAWFVSYVKVQGVWWFISDHDRVVRRMADFAAVQEATRKNAVLLFFDKAVQ